MTRFYFAYGSNLLIQRLTARCPTARPLGPATLSGHRVEFAKLSSVDGSGKATILPQEGRTAHGVLFELALSDLEALDLIEGVGHGYHRLDRVGVQLDGETIGASTYIASAPTGPIRPLDWYLALILAGAHQHALPGDVHRDFRAQPFTTDTEACRPGRLAAIAALEAAGHADWLSLLQDAPSSARSSSS
jgi:hypothetical protein